MTKTTGNFTDFVTFSRASGGTYLDSDGLIKTAATNVPRVEYDASGNLKGLLVEEARTNLFVNSGSPETQVCTVTPGTSYTLGFTSGSATVDLDETIASTAVDVFVYDTSKDSDGGAWRAGALAQASSWYNETLNTATRGARREFPAVAVLVLEAAKLTIYDADDPALPMWMVFNTGLGAVVAYGDAVTSVAALNGEIVVGTAGAGGLSRISLFEKAYQLIQAGGNYTIPARGVLVNRNSGVAWPSISSAEPRLVNSLVNDVAMTVLPDAPVDPATGLPVPTIAVATAGGLSVIRQSGTVVNSGSTGAHPSVAIIGNSLFYQQSGAGDPTYRADLQSISAGFGTQIFDFNDGSVFPARLAAAGSDLAIRSDRTPFGMSRMMLNGSGAIIAEAHIKSGFNTGWLPGAIKGAFLSSKDTASLVASGELVTNGDFGTNDLTGWTVANDGTGTSSGATGAAVLSYVDASNKGKITQAITNAAGVSFIVQFTVSGTRNAYVEFGGTALGTFAPGSHAVTVTPANANTTLLVNPSSAGTGSLTIDNISVRRADADRSVNARGLVVNGTITRAPVATGAELVGYRGFSGANFLEQPYNPGLDFGTGDFCLMGWVNTVDSYATFFRLGDSSIGTPKILVGTYPSPTAGNLEAYILGSPSLRPNVLTPTGWFHWALVRANGQATLYANSVPLVSVASVGDLSLTGTETLRVGVRHDGNQSLDSPSSLALLRISATAPTAEQIAKIYEDEKVLFQENAACTLYGTSDAVTALAHDPDTGLLHVGTSAGRSVFQGLRRINNTTTGVTTAISATNGIIAEQ